MRSLFQIPSWQNGITLTDTNGNSINPSYRCISDVSFDSGVYGGLGRVPWSASGPEIDYIVGGTSAGSPFWAALVALACQVHGGNLGDINPALYAFYNGGTAYSSGAFHDITTGDDTYPFGGTVPGYKATTG